MSRPDIIPTSYSGTPDKSEGKPFGPHFIKLPDGRTAQMVDANLLFAGIRTENGGPLEGGSEFIILNLVHACSQCQHGLVYQFSAAEAESVAAGLMDLAGVLKANASTLATAALDRARQGGAK